MSPLYATHAHISSRCGRLTSGNEVSKTSEERIWGQGAESREPEVPNERYCVFSPPLCLTNERTSTGECARQRDEMTALDG